MTTPPARPRLLLADRLVRLVTGASDDEFDLLVLDGSDDPDPLIADEGGGATAMIAWGNEPIHAAWLDRRPDLRLIAVIAAGMDGIDLAECARRGIAVTNAGDLNADDVADYALAMVLAHRREVVGNDRYVRADRWVTEGRRPLGRSLGGERVGVVGLGHIGQAVAQRLAACRCDIAWWGPRAKPDAAWPRHDSLIDLAGWAQTLVVAVRAGDDTHGLVTGEVLAALGPDGLIVNVARGFVVDEPAMIAALRAGTLGGAALDVLADEPFGGSAWADVPNLLLSPHVAGATAASVDRVAHAGLENVRAFFAGRPLRHRVV